MRKYFSRLIICILIYCNYYCDYLDDLYQWLSINENKD
jgi:uncharacterized membrane protein YoaT (DUF817 family)